MFAGRDRIPAGQVAALWGVCPRTARWRMRVLLTRLAARPESEGVPIRGRPQQGTASASRRYVRDPT